MSKSEIARPLSFPVPFPDIPSCLVFAGVPRQAVLGYLGPAMFTDLVDGLGPADFWGFEYPCGLQVVFEFLHESGGGRIIADSPEIEHILRHIPFPAESCIRVDQECMETELTQRLLAFPDRQSEIESLHSFQVWRQGTDGNPFKVGSPTSKRDAECWVNQLDSLGHHQHYWCERVGTE